jgi:hypothetical protein
VWVLGVFLVSLAVAAGVAALLLHRAEPFLRARIVAALEERFHARVELDSFHMSLVDGLRAEGKGLRIWSPAQAEGASSLEPSGQIAPSNSATDEVSPLIRLDAFRFHAPLRFQSGKPFHISTVQLEGLDIHLPPKSHFAHIKAKSPEFPDAPKNQFAMLNFQVDAIECTRAKLTLGTNKPGKLPLQFDIARLRLTNPISGGSMNYEAELTNPRPQGTIHTTGSFGPWLVDDPGESAVAGDYRFDHADLSSFKGIGGILSSTGHYQGTLRNLAVDGQTDTPDFRLTHFGNTLPLHTQFRARVDATDGDTVLDSVDATLGRSHFTAQGQIVRVIAKDTRQSMGHDIALTVNVDRARIEDFLRLASHSPTPLLTGAVQVKTTLHIPPGTAPVHQRLKLNGSFTLDQAQFTSPKIQDRIEELSLRGQGRPTEVKTTDPASVHSQMKGSFQLADGVIALPALEYTVPGADIQLKGSYGLEGGTLNFAGVARMEATVSQMVGGWKGQLLKSVDSFFKKNGVGTQIPIHIEGTREEPKFGIDFGRLK